MAPSGLQDKGGGVAGPRGPGPPGRGWQAPGGTGARTDGGAAASEASVSQSLHPGPGLRGLETPPAIPVGRQAAEPRLEASGQNLHFSGGIHRGLKNILFSTTIFYSLFIFKK